MLIIIAEKAIYEIFQKEAAFPEYNSSTNQEHVLHTVMLLFREYVDGAMMDEIDDQEASWEIKWA